MKENAFNATPKPRAASIPIRYSRPGTPSKATSDFIYWFYAVCLCVWHV